MTVRRMGPATLVVAPRPAEPPAMLRRPDASSTGTSDARHAGWPAQCTWRRTARLPRAWPAAAATDGAPGEQQAARYAIIGAGLAGVATAWHLLKAHQQRRDPRPVQLHLFDAWGIASGGSGAAAGLLHPFSPKGKLLWRAEEAFPAALELVAVAEHAAAYTARTADCQAPTSGVVWRGGLVRPALTTKQARDFARAAASLPSTSAPSEAALKEGSLGAAVPGAHAPLVAHTLTAEQLSQLLPGVQAHPENPPTCTADDAAAPAQPTTQQQPQGTTAARAPSRRQRRAAAAGGPAEGLQGQPSAAAAAAALWAPCGVVLDVELYLRALWRSCQELACPGGGGGNASSPGTLPPGSEAVLHLRRVPSLAQLAAWGRRRDVGAEAGAAGGGGWTAVVVAAGAAVETLPELEGALPLQLCQGYTSVLRPAPTAPGTRYPEGSPSLLGSTYLAAQHGGTQLVVGATKRYGVSAEQALQGGAPSARVVRPAAVPAAPAPQLGQGGAREEEAVRAAEELGERIGAVWPGVRAGWQLAEVRSGVRALPPRTAGGSLPLLGRLEGAVVRGSAAAGAAAPLPPVWVVAGLGSRGLVYHAWLGEQLARAVLADDEGVLAPELLAWRSLADGKALFDAP